MTGRAPQRRPRKNKTTEVAPTPIVVEPTSAPPVEEPPVVEQPPVKEEEESSASAQETREEKKGQRKKAVYEELRADVDEVLNKLLGDLSTAKVQKNKELGNVLKTYEKALKKVKSNIKRVEPKTKKTVVRTCPYGFNKPQNITPEMAAFAGWNPAEPKSRTDVTVALCDYVRRNNLQRSDHRREIVPDASLASILRYDATSNEPLTYSTMQKHIGHLFVSASS